MKFPNLFMRVLLKEELRLILIKLVKYQGEEAVFSIPDGEILSGTMKTNKKKLVEAWIEIHQDELNCNPN